MPDDITRLRSQNYTGSLSDMRKEKLADKGFSNIYEYLTSLGITGSLSDRLYSRAIELGFSSVSEMSHVYGSLGAALLADTYLNPWLTGEGLVDDGTLFADPLLVD